MVGCPSFSTRFCVCTLISQIYTIHFTRSYGENQIRTAQNLLNLSQNREERKGNRSSNSQFFPLKYPHILPKHQTFVGGSFAFICNFFYKTRELITYYCEK